MRESGQISGLLSLPVVLPLWFGSAIAENPTSILTQALTFIPFTAPVTLIFRLVHGSLPLWQLLASSAILVLAIFGAIWLAARLFRGTTLLTGARPTPRAIWRALRKA
jgi:ABC-2 type transport system permease protein